MNLLELIGRDTALRKKAGTDGGEYAGACPWCGGVDRFRVWPNADRPRYWCRKCNRKGDAIQYLRDRDNLTYPEACRRAGCSLAKLSRSAATPFSLPPQLIIPPPAAWQAKARELCELGEQRLWTPAGLKAREYLYRRGLQDETILAARMGYHHALRWERRETWGLPPDPEGKPLWLPPGIVFPWWRELARWTEERQELWAERAAIMEVEGGLSRDQAERQAFELLREHLSQP